MSYSEEFIEFFVISQNVCFLTDLKHEQIYDRVVDGQVFAWMGQETGRLCPEGVDFQESRGCVTIHAGSRTRRHGSKARAGVMLALSPIATLCWKRSGRLISYSPRHVAVELTVHGRKVVLASAYAPVSSEAFALRSAFYDLLDSFSTRANTILLLGIDANASVGCGTTHRRSSALNNRHLPDAVGPWNLPHVNSAGRDFLEFLTSRNLCLANTFFKKRNAAAMATWIHHRTGQGFALDHFVTNHFTRMRFCTNCKKAAGFGVDSDHSAMLMSMRFPRRRKRGAAFASTTQTAQPRAAPTASPRTTQRLDYSALADPTTARAFAVSVRAELRGLRSGCQPASAAVQVAELEAAMIRAGQQQLPPLTRCKANWYKDSQETLALKAASVRQAFHFVSLHPQSKSARRRLRLARAAQRRAKKWAIERFAFKVTAGTNAASWSSTRQLINGRSNFRPHNRMAFSRDSMVSYLTDLFNGVRPGTDPAVTDHLRQREVRHDLDVAPTLGELVASVRASKSTSSAAGDVPFCYYKALVGDTPSMRLVLGILRSIWTSGPWVSGQRPRLSRVRDLPDWDTLGLQDRIDVAKEHNLRVEFLQDNPKRLGSASRDRYQLYKSAQTLTEALERGAWEGDLTWDGERNFYQIFPEPLRRPLNWTASPSTVGQWVPDWNMLRCVLIYKGSGKPLDKMKSWRSIMLMHALASILAGILQRRIQSVSERCGMEPQCAFRRDRGSFDAIHVRDLAIRKRQEHGHTTWVLYIDWCVAYDSVNHAVLWRVLEKFGFPPHFLQILRRFYTGLTFKVEYQGGEPAVISYTSGVKQGCRTSPDLWNFIIQAIFEVAQPAFVGKLSFQTDFRSSAAPGGTRWKNQGSLPEGFELSHVVQADDTSLMAVSRPSLVHNAVVLNCIAELFGTKLHAGRGGEASKTFGTAYPGAGVVDALVLSDIRLPDGGRLPFLSTPTRYLGVHTDSSFRSCVSINVKLTQASMKFGALAASIFRNRRVSQAAKRRVYLSMVLSTLLFGSHVWVPTAADWRRLENFHHEKVRIMAGVNLFAMRRHRISNSALLRRLRLHPIRAYVGKVCLRWVGKVARMPLHRLPRRLLFAFLNCPRSSRARKTYASAIKEHLRYFDISQEAATWTRLAQNPTEWDRMLDDILLAHHGY